MLIIKEKPNTKKNGKLQKNLVLNMNGIGQYILIIKEKSSA